MPAALRMPDIGTVEGEVTLVRWLKSEGDTVALGEPLFEVETDKGVSEVESAMAGVLAKRVVGEGAKAGTGDIIAYFRQPGETEGGGKPGVAEPASSAPAAPPAVKAAPPLASAPQPVVEPPSGPSASGPASSTVSAGVIPAGASRVPPAIRALAEKYGVDLSVVKGTGPAGLITRADVLSKRGGAKPALVTPSGLSTPIAFAAPTAAAGAPKSVRDGLSLSRSQGVIARKVSQSHREKPVYRVNAIVEMTKAIALREQARQGPEGKAPSFDALLAKTVAMALAEFPVFRQYLKGDELVEHRDIDVAIAVGVGDDLFIPAVRDTVGKSIEEISRAIDALAKKAESRALAPQDVEGSCFLVSNLGMYPVESFDAIIYPDHSAALAVGTTISTPVSDGGSMRVAPMARLTLSVDHRLINGTTAARFIARVKQILENGEFA
jgi:pyruvate dehydrogenase E2 component (dihydrolipoamide acetyltransferase)